MTFLRHIMGAQMGADFAASHQSALSRQSLSVWGSGSSCWAGRRVLPRGRRGGHAGSLPPDGLSWAGLLQGLTR